MTRRRVLISAGAEAKLALVPLYTLIAGLSRVIPNRRTTIRSPRLAMRRAFVLGLLLVAGCRGCRLPSHDGPRDAAAAPVFDAGPPFPETALPYLPPGTRIIRSRGFAGYGQITADARAVYWSATPKFQWAPLISGRPPLGISVAGIELDGARELAEPRRIQPSLTQDAASIYALQEYAKRDCEYGLCKVPKSTDVYRISKQTGASTRIATVPEWVEAPLVTDDHLLLAGAMSAKLWSIDLAGAGAGAGEPKVVASGLQPHVIALAKVGSTLYVLSDDAKFYGAGTKRSLARLPLPLSDGAAPDDLALTRSLDWIAGGDHLYAGVTGDDELFRLRADGAIEARLSDICPESSRRDHRRFAKGRRKRWRVGRVAPRSVRRGV